MDVVVGSEARRMRQFIDLTLAQSRGDWVTMAKLPVLGSVGPDDKLLSAVVLVVLNLGNSHVGACSNGALPISVGHFDQGTA